MPLKFTDSQTCEIDGKNFTFFRDSLQLLKQVEKRVSELGGKKFYSSTDPDVKKDREGLPLFLFLVALKKLTNRDWFLMQPVETFPDSLVMSVGESEPRVNLEGIELTEIPPMCPTFEEALKIVNKKLNNKYQSNNYNLVIFINNVQSRAWINQLNDSIQKSDPFLSIWTILMLANSDNTQLKGAIIHRLQPRPNQSIPFTFDEKNLFTQNTPPDFIEKISVDGRTFLNFRPDFIKDFIKAFRQLRAKKKEES